MDRINEKQFKQELELQRAEVLKSLRQVESERQSLDVESPKDSGDQSVTSLSTESLFERSSQRRTVLRLIEAALWRIAEGSFGVCVTCGEGIPERRLEALPWTQFCLRCQEVIEEEVNEDVSTRMPSPVAAVWKRAS
ncbi:MAG TPA: TraR/DksA family transcriptional regulator [Candidatus Sulfotelmatobacter sp.]|jgi:DnaK suppressor protein|nr:TraR/DksA family transcriptional regulator [Candidatus Sulfotelmatobacter sp.]